MQINSDYVHSEMTTTMWEKFTDFVCSGDGARIFVGDHLEAASPADPSFW